MKSRKIKLTDFVNKFELLGFILLKETSDTKLFDYEEYCDVFFDYKKHIGSISFHKFGEFVLNQNNFDVSNIVSKIEEILENLKDCYIDFRHGKGRLNAETFGYKIVCDGITLHNISVFMTNNDIEHEEKVSILSLLKTELWNMELKILKKVQISKTSDLKINRMQIEESIKQLNQRNDYGFFVPIGTGKLTNYNDLDEIAFVAYNFRLIDGWITADLRASKEVYGYFIDEAIKNSSDWLKERIKFIPEYDNDLIIWWNLENVHSSNEKKKEQLLNESIKSIISNGQKMIHMNFCFLLPKGFKGGLDEAFNYFTEQHKLKSELNEINTSVDDIVDNDHNDVIYKWARLAQNHGFRFYSESSLNEIETDDNGKILSIKSV